MKTTYETIGEVKTAKQIFDFLTNSFQLKIGSAKYGTTTKLNWSEFSETVLMFIRDIANKALAADNTKMLSEKQAWCISYEFLKIIHLYEAWVESEIAKYAEVEEVEEDRTLEIIENAQRNCENLKIGKLSIEFRENERQSYGLPSDGRYCFYVFIEWDDNFAELYSDDRDEVIEYTNLMINKIG